MSKKKEREGSAGSVGRFEYNDILKEALKVIKRHKLCFIEDVVIHLKCGKTTFYKLKLNESNEIKEAIWGEKRRTKLNRMRKRWEDSENATLQVGLYKLLANDDELERLNNSKQKTEVVIKDDRSEAEIMRNIEDLKNTVTDDEYDINKDGGAI